MMRLSQCAHVLQATLKGLDGEYSGVSIDSRTVQAGDLFVAVKGDHFDGHAFVEKAVEKGAAGAIVEKPISVDAPTIVVQDSLNALTQLARAQRAACAIPVVALTGSCGKTTTKDMLANILGQVGNTLATAGNYNNHLGVPLSLLRLTEEHQFAVFELGANHVGEIAQLTALVKPTVALITQVAPVHVEGFGSLEAIASAKGEIYQGLVEEGTAIINADDCFADDWRALIGDKRCTSFGREQSADVTATHIKADEKGCARFTLTCLQGECELQLPLIGLHQVTNALAAASAALALDVDLSAIKQGLETVKPASKRLQEHVTQQGARLIDDSYNANPVAAKAAIDILKARGRETVLVMGDMVELGADAAAYHVQVGQYAKEQGIKHFYAFGELARHYVQGFGVHHAQHFTEMSVLIDHLKQLLTQENVILVKGSRAMQMERIVHSLVKE